MAATQLSKTVVIAPRMDSRFFAKGRCRAFPCFCLKWQKACASSHIPRGRCVESGWSLINVTLSTMLIAQMKIASSGAFNCYQLFISHKALQVARSSGHSCIFARNLTIFGIMVIPLAPGNIRKHARSINLPNIVNIRGMYIVRCSPAPSVTFVFLLFDICLQWRHCEAHS